jgi:MtN3 and saliva related transmembrane protein
MIDAIGFVAATFTALAFLPQVLKTWRSRSAGDLSVSMLLAQATGVALWILYGVAIASHPIIVANIVTLTLTLMLLLFKRVYSTADAGSRTD